MTSRNGAATRSMCLAWRNLAHDRVRLAVTVAGIAFSVVLMTLQGGLFVGFLSAAARLVNASGADLWITARGVPCFDFTAPLPRGYGEIAMSAPGAVAATRIVSGFTTWQRPDGQRRTVTVIGVEPSIGGGFPLPRFGTGEGALPRGVVIDRTSSAELAVFASGAEVEIGGLRAQVTRIAEGFSSFLGCPYVFTSYDDAVRYLQIPSERTMAVAVRLAAGASTEKAVLALKERLPQADVWTGPEFARRSGGYWMAQTGAGGAIALAGFLGFVVGVAVVSQAVYAATMEHIEEFATLRAMGASRGFILGLVLTQALGAGGAGWVLGSLVALPLAALVRAHAVPWLQAPSWLVLATGLASLAMCALASVSAMRTAISVDPGTVFRA